MLDLAILPVKNIEIQIENAHRIYLKLALFSTKFQFEMKKCGF
jgi:hypothetical protein